MLMLEGQGLVSFLIWRFPHMGVAQNGWYSMENPIKHMDDVEVSNVSIVIRVPLKIAGWLFHGKYHL